MHKLVQISGWKNRYHCHKTHKDKPGLPIAITEAFRSISMDLSETNSPNKYLMVKRKIIIRGSFL